ncbi:MAG: hypothetical protein RMJ51_05915 [Candidatus Calescibacterium sp.]|nr:hypothetical protein [Candidatus Calescibacterium sp.]MCX7972611.1 hypothetical protein [bacterium]MDW8195754.1 hypothetical protein [Candidatus Calescibacterium sp.]
MLKALPLKPFPLTRDINNTFYLLVELIVLIENLSKYKYSGYLEIKGSKNSFIVLIDEGMVVSYVDVTDNPIEISPLIFRYRVEEEIKVVTYTMPIGFSSILRGFYLFENQIMNYSVNGYKDWESFWLKLSKRNITGIMEINMMEQTYYLLVKSGNPFIRSDIINNNNLVISSYFYNEFIIQKIKNNAKCIVNVTGIDNKELEEKLKENDIKHSLVRELEVKEKGWSVGSREISISSEIVEFWTSTLQSTSIALKIEGLEGDIKNIQVKKDPKLPPDIILVPQSILQRIKIRDRRVVSGEKIVVYPEIP